MNCKLNKLETEKRNKKTINLDTMDALAIATIMNEEDKNVVKAVKKELPNIAKVIDMATLTFKNGGRIIYLGAGSSGRYAIVDAVECPPTFGISKNVFKTFLAGGDNAVWESAEGAEDNLTEAVDDLKKYGLNSRDLVIGLAASGRTPYVIGGLKYAKSINSKIATISCNKNDLIGNYADIAIRVSSGPEILTGSTRLKCGTAEKMILNMISTGTMVRSGKVYQNLMVDVIQSNEKLRERAVSIVMEATACSKDIAEEKLNDANGYCKVAITSILLNCSATIAKKKLDENNGFIREACKTKQHD